MPDPQQQQQQLVHPKTQVRNTILTEVSGAVDNLGDYLWGDQTVESLTPEQKQQLQKAVQQAPTEPSTSGSQAEPPKDETEDKEDEQQDESTEKQSHFQKQAYPMAVSDGRSRRGGGVSQAQMRQQINRLRETNPRLARQFVQYLVGSVPVAGVPGAGITGAIQSPKNTSGGLGSFLGAGFGQLAGGMAGAGIGDMVSRGGGRSAARLLSMLGGGLLGTSVGGGVGSALGFGEGVKTRKQAAFNKGYQSVVDKL